MRYLYKITNLLNGRVYIGQSYSEIERWRQHKYAARSSPRQYIDCAIKKYGVINFIYEVIAVSLTQEDGHLTEIELIKQYNSRDRNFGYNISPGGDEIWNKGLPKEQHPMYGKRHSIESRKKMSEALSGENHPLYGKSHVPATIEKMSLVKLGKVCSEEHRNNISKSKTGANNPNFGTHHSDEWNLKISISNTGKIRSEVSKKKQSITRTGFTVSEDTKIKISHSMLGEMAPLAKLSNVQRIEILNKKQNGISAESLAKEYNVSKKTIHEIVKKGLYFIKSNNESNDLTKIVIIKG